MLRQLNRERGQTIILVTHDPEVGAASDRIVLMRDGLIVGGEPRAMGVPVIPHVDASIPVPAVP
jgi:ABC-type lipoprotein export system ATPase subunit